MIAPAPVLIDTCVWVPFFNRKPSAEKQAVASLILTNRAVLIGPVLAEVLRGFRRQQQADWANAALKIVQYIEMNREDWRAAGRLGRQIAARGHRLPLTDLAVAAVAEKHRYVVYSSDPHFDLVPGLTRFRIE